MMEKTATIIYNTSLAAQGALAHRLQRRPRPIHNNAKSGAHPCSLPLGFNMAGWDLGGGAKKKISKTVFKCLDTKFLKRKFDPPLGVKKNFLQKSLEMSQNENF